MGWRGTLRSMSAAAHAAERNAERRRKQYAKARMTAAAGQAVEEWEEIIHDLVSIHTHHAAAIDWHRIADRVVPQPPLPSDANEREASVRLALFKPRIFDFLVGGSERRREKLALAIGLAKARDEETFRVSEEKYRTDLAEWKAETDLARRLLLGEADAIRNVVAEIQALSSEGLIGTAINLHISDGSVHAVVLTHTDEVVPKVRRKQLQSGRLSESKMPIGEFNELYQDYICSAALRVGGDLLSILPLDEVYVTCMPLLLDSVTGHQRHTPILSVRIVRDTFDRLDLSRIDPSDAITGNFSHEMNFKRAKGFAPIGPLKPID